MPHMDGPNIETLATDGNMTIADIIAMLGMLDDNEEGIPTDEVAISVSGDVGSMPEGLQALLGGLMGEEETSDLLVAVLLHTVQGQGCIQDIVGFCELRTDLMHSAADLEE